MRAFLWAALASTAVATIVAPAVAHGDHPYQIGLIQLYATADESNVNSEPRDVAPGQVMVVSGGCLAGEDDDVRVVLSLADGLDARTGFHEMLATDEARSDGSLRVRVPNLEEARNHVFRVKLFVGDDDPQVCDAGAIRVV